MLACVRGGLRQVTHASLAAGGFTQYAHTKLMNAMFAAELQARSDESEQRGGGGLEVSGQ